MGLLLNHFIAVVCLIHIACCSEFSGQMCPNKKPIGGQVYYEFDINTPEPALMYKLTTSSHIETDWVSCLFHHSDLIHIRQLMMKDPNEALKHFYKSKDGIRLVTCFFSRLWLSEFPFISSFTI